MKFIEVLGYAQYEKQSRQVWRCNRNFLPIWIYSRRWFHRRIDGKHRFFSLTGFMMICENNPEYVLRLSSNTLNYRSFPGPIFWRVNVIWSEAGSQMGATISYSVGLSAAGILQSLDEESSGAETNLNVTIKWIFFLLLIISNLTCTTALTITCGSRRAWHSKSIKKLIIVFDCHIFILTFLVSVVCVHFYGINWSEWCWYVTMVNYLRFIFVFRFSWHYMLTLCRQ